MSEEKREFRPPSDMTHDELAQLARDYAAGLVYSDQHIQQRDLFPTVFMPVAFGLFSGATEEQLETVGMIYEYLEKAGPRGINGHPSFFSCRMLSANDLPKLKKMVDAIRAAVDNALAPA